MLSANRNILLDILKGFAILGVILYHLGLLPLGYLGVEIFFVIAGYLTTKSVLKSLSNDTFSYSSFIVGKLIRLCPLVLLVTAFSMLLGYFCLLPDVFKNVGETSVGSSLFVNNFVQCITSSDYWDTGNDYKPLMHTWYIGVLFQFYILYPLICMLIYKTTSRKREITLFFALVILGMVSLFSYLSPFITDAYKFYLLPSRFFEFIIGALVAFSEKYKNVKSENIFKILISVFLLAILLIINIDFTSNQSKVLVTSFLTMYIIIISSKTSFVLRPKVAVLIKPFVYCGVASYSLYLWHQPIMAFYRSIITPYFHTLDYIIILVICGLVGFISYELIEKGISSFIKSKKDKGNIVLINSLFLAFLLVGLGFYVYKRNGVVRDIPELNVKSSDPKTWEVLAYNDKNSKLDKDFEKNKKVKVLVLGDSYARDWINILKESGVTDSMNISYHRGLDVETRKRASQADYIFIACKTKIEEYMPLLPLLEGKKYYRVGTKNFGLNNGFIYAKSLYFRYKQQYAEIPSAYLEENYNQKLIFGSHYIDMISPVLEGENHIRIFTSTNKYFSHDCLHLTQAGAIEYAKLLPIKSYFQ